MTSNIIYDSAEIFPIDIALEAAKIILVQEGFDIN